MLNDWASLTIVERQVVGTWSWHAHFEGGTIRVTISRFLLEPNYNFVWGFTLPNGRHRTFNSAEELNQILNDYKVTHLDAIRFG